MGGSGWLLGRWMDSYRVSHKKVPPFDQTWERNDKISGIFYFIGIFVDLRLKCTYLAF